VTSPRAPHLVAIALSLVAACSAGDPMGGPGPGGGPAGAPPTITAFSASPSTIASGDSATLTVDVANATTVRIDGVGDVTGRTSTTVSPTATTVFQLVATNDSGSSTAEATVIVNLAPAPLATDHPRLFIRSSDVPQLRAWATASNPIWVALDRLATTAKSDMDAGHVPGDDAGAPYYSEYPTELYAELFAFLSLVDPDAAHRADYAARARTLLMHAVDEAAKGLAANQPFRDPDFAINDRSRWNGEGFPLTVDWIYPSLTAQDKATIRTVFLRWIAQDIHESYNRPTPPGVTFDPQVYANLRWALNNYAAAHMRNIGLMSMALDDADDPGGQLRGFLSNAIGAWLYKTDRLLRTDAAGGLSPEGFEYGPQSLGYTAQLLLALRTAGQDDPARWQGFTGVQLSANPFWAGVVPCFLNSLSPVPQTRDYRGPLYDVAWYGDGEHEIAPDAIETLGPLAVYDRLTSNPSRAQAIRWIETHMAPGGAAALADRVGRTDQFFHAILYFLAFDPTAGPLVDPRPTTPSTVFAPGTGRLLARTAWSDDATWFDFSLGWQEIDHQDGDGLSFELYRKGEFLTKRRIGYGYGYESSDNANSLGIENDAPDHLDAGRTMLWQRGSQWLDGTAGDPTFVALSTDARFVHASGDATNLYNSQHENISDVKHASRSIVWLKPDIVVVYDRATTGKANRFKRFWLSTPMQATVSGRRATVTTAKGQALVVSSLLPAGATVEAQPWPNESDALGGAPADFEPMKFRLKIEDPAKPADVRFLTVLEGADAGAPPKSATLVESTAGTPYQGALVGTTVVLFPVALGAPFGGVTFASPSGATLHVVTGLAPRTGHTVTRSGQTVSISVGGTAMTDGGGVLAF